VSGILTEPTERAPVTTLPAITSEQMREIDRLMIERVGIALLQMMENAGRNLAELVRRLWPEDLRRGVVVLAGKGGNGGGAIAAGRHLRNRGAEVTILLSERRSRLSEAAAL